MKPILDIQDIYTYFYTESGVVEALDGVSFDVMPGEPVGIVGESGCGKTVTAHSTLRILPKNGKTIAGKIMYRGTNLLDLPDLQMRRIRGKEIAMIFQDPMTSLNPIFKIADQMTEVIALHRKCNKKEALEVAIETLEQVGISDADKRIVDYLNKIYINTNLTEFKTNKSFHEITTFDNIVINKRLHYCLGVFNISADGPINVDVEIEDLAGNKYSLEKEN